MRTWVEVVARAGPGGRTVLPVLRAGGQLAVRRTGPHTVHLVATAAGPLGGDVAELVLRVEAGARLAVRSVAAAVVLPHRDGTASRSDLEADVAAGGELGLGLEPTVVAARAEHRGTLHARVADGGALTCTEQIVLGRSAEQPGRWTGTVRVERAGSPVLHTTVELGPGAPGWSAPFTPRAYASVLRLGGPDGPAGSAVGADAVRLPLPGGWTATGWGSELNAVLAAVGLLSGTPGRVAR